MCVCVCVFVCAQNLVYTPCKTSNSMLAMPECSDKGPNKDSNGKKKIEENCNTSNLTMHIIRLMWICEQLMKNKENKLMENAEYKTILGFGMLFVFCFSVVPYVLSLY